MITMSRYEVTIYGRIRPDAGLGTIDVTQSFGSRARAERFAHAISKQLPVGPSTNGCVQAWVLVYALPIVPNGMHGHCYLSFDPGGVLVKRHQIVRGFWGHGARTRVVNAGGR
jgi:hypothetical protein